MWKTFFGFKRIPFPDCPDPKQLFTSSLESGQGAITVLVDHHATGLLTGEVGAGKSTAARPFSRSLNPSLHKILNLHLTSGSCLDPLLQLGNCGDN